VESVGDNLLLEADGVTVAFGGIVALRDVSFAIAGEEIVGLIGPNGAGKTTLFNVLTRLQQPISGAVRYAGHDLLAEPPHRMVGLGVARTFQHVALVPEASVLDNVMIGCHAGTAANWLTAPLRIGVGRDGRRAQERARDALEALELGALAERPVEGLPLGTLKRVELARALASGPRLLLLDEPANGLTHAEVGELGEVIAALRGRHGMAIMLVEHHMGLIMEVCDRIVVLDFGAKIAEGEPASVAADPAVVDAYMGGGVS
jgi:branched-chain amino acid transport system ATP-binding protein